MKNAILLFVALAVVAAGAFFALRLPMITKVNSATKAESEGDYAAALAGYANAMNRTFPGLEVPDVNRSKVLSPGTWKKNMEAYAGWLSGTAANVDPKKRRTLIDAVVRNSARVRNSNFLLEDTAQTLTVENYSRLWQSAFFAKGVEAGSLQIPLAASCFSKAISIIKISALTVYTYEMTLVDTVTSRRTTFTVYPENTTFILAVPGRHMLICKCWYKPGPDKIWRSSPALLPLIVPEKPSLCSYIVQTRVERKAEEK